MMDALILTVALTVAIQSPVEHYAVPPSCGYQLIGKHWNPTARKAARAGMTGLDENCLGLITIHRAGGGITVLNLRPELAGVANVIVNTLTDPPTAIAIDIELSPKVRCKAKIEETVRKLKQALLKGES